MSPRRHADDDAGSPGLADALARWDIAQDWMRARQDVPPDPGGWPDPADPPVGPPPDAGAAGALAPDVSPGGAGVLAEPPPGTAVPTPGMPAEANEHPPLPWAAQNPPPERWRRRPGLDNPRHGLVAPPQQPASAGWQLPPPPSAPESWDALLSDETSHSAKETQLMSTSAPGGEARQPHEPQPPAPGGAQSSTDPTAPDPDARGQEPHPPPGTPGVAGVPDPAAAPLPWEAPARQQPPRQPPPDSPGAPRRPEEPTQLMQPPATQAPPWESPGWGGPPAAAGDRPTGEQPATGPTGPGHPPAGAPPVPPGSPPAEPAAHSALAADTGTHPSAGEPAATGGGPPAPAAAWPSGEPSGGPRPPAGEPQAGPPGPPGPPAQPGVGSPGAPPVGPPAMPPGVPPSGSFPGGMPPGPPPYPGAPATAWPPQPPQPPPPQPGWQQGAGPAAGAPEGSGGHPQVPDQAVRLWSAAGPPPGQAPPQQGWAPQQGGGPWSGYDPRWTGAQPPGDMPVWAPPGERGAPTVEDLTAQSLIRQRRRTPQTGWRKALYTLSAHSVNPGEAPFDVRRRELTERATVPVRGCYRIAVISLKGGVGKTTMTVCLGATLASLRGDRVIAVDANPDRGTLSGKLPLETVATVRNLLNDADRIGRYSDVRRYTSQSPDRLEVLASESDPAVSIAFSEQDYRVVAGILERFYNVVLTDCGTGLLHSAMSGVLALANQLVLVSSGSVDGARSASATLDWLEAHGHRSLVAGSVAVINSVRPKSGGVDLDKLQEHFAARCRSVVRVPYDPHLEEGAEVDLSALRDETCYALLELAAYTADGFPRDGGLPRSAAGMERAPGQRG